MNLIGSIPEIVLEFLNHIDHSLFLFLNGIHSPFFDFVIYQITKSMVWIPLYLVFLSLVIRQYRWKTILILLMAAVMILVSDQLANLAKDTFQRLRPSHEPGLMVHLVNAYKGGEYGFYSSHATNTFSIAVFLCVTTGKRIKWIWLIAIPWALLMSYTRIYLGVHFPGDILAGILMGSLIGYFSGRMGLFFLSRGKKKETHVPHNF
jgi:undecaprenyl-diphosphatase